MTVCDNNHQEICYIGDTCPLCSLQEDFSYLLEEDSRLEATLDELESRYDALTKLVAKHAPELLV